MKISNLYESTSSNSISITEIQGLSETLRNNCSQIYKSFYNEPDVRKLRHSTSSERNGLYYDVPNKKNRLPTDTPLFFHNIMDEILYEKYDARFRSNAIFSYYRTPSNSYYTIFPYDGYKMVTSPKVYDMYVTLENVLHKDSMIKEYMETFLIQHGNLEKIADPTIFGILSYIFDLISKESWTKDDDSPAPTSL